MSTELWAILTVALAMIAVSGWGLSFWLRENIVVEARERYVAEKMLSHTEHILDVTERALIYRENETRKQGKKIRRLQQSNHYRIPPDDELRYPHEALKARLRGRVNPVEFVCNQEKWLAEWCEEQMYGHWKIYLYRERWIREEGGKP
jgi:hypothetical protein